MKEKLINVLKLFSPHTYKDVVKLKTKELIKIWMIPVIAFLIFFIIAGTVMGMMKLGSADVQDNFETFEININQTQKEGFFLLTKPDIYMDLNTNQTNDTKMAFLEKGIAYNKYLWWGKTQIAYKDLKDIKSPSMQNVLRLFLIIMVPGLVLLWIIIMIVKYCIIGLIFIPLGMIANKLFRQQGSWKDQTKAYIAMTVIFMIFDLLIFPFYRMYWIPLFVGIIFYLIVSLLIGKKHFSQKKKY